MRIARRSATAAPRTRPRSAAEGERAASPSLPARLQRSLGNRAVGQLVQSEDLGSGQKLAPADRVFFEAALGTSLRDVRVHTDSGAARVAGDLGARALTRGSDVVFGSGHYAPRSRDGRWLLAHELTHVVQQRNDQGAPRVQGFFESIARFFGGGSFSDQELGAYLAFLDKNKRIEDDYDSDNKARVIVERWQQGNARFVLSLERKILLIKEMLSGFTGDDDEQAILSLLRGATDAEFPVILARVGEAELKSNLHWAESDQLDDLLAARTGKRSTAAGGAAGGAGSAGGAASKHVFDDQTLSEAHGLFTSNALLEKKVRQNCIEIIRTVAPRLFGRDPKLAGRVSQELGKLKGDTLTMPDAGRVLTALGVATGPIAVKFDPGNGKREPQNMVGSVWDEIIAQVGTDQGWHIFGLSIMDGYHSVTVLVDNRADGQFVYWADQWRIDPGDNFKEERPGSVSGFRLYQKKGFDDFITERTIGWWNDVHKAGSKCGKRWGARWDEVCRYPTTTHIWHFRTGK